MSRPTKLYWDKWFWSRWENDEGLKLCSGGAQGLWMRMLCICARSTPRGYLLIAKRRRFEAPTLAELAKLTAFAESDIAHWLIELETNAVFSRTESGHALGPSVIFNRFMVRRDEEAPVHAANGRLGGNPALLPEYDAGLAELRAIKRKEKAADRQRKRRAALKTKRQKGAERGGECVTQKSVTGVTLSRSERDSHTGEKRDARSKNDARSKRSGGVTGVNPRHNPKEEKNLRISNPERKSSTPGGAPPSPSIGGGAPVVRDSEPLRGGKEAGEGVRDKALRAIRERLGVGQESADVIPLRKTKP